MVNPKYMRLASDIHLDSTYTGKVKSGMTEFDLLWSPVQLPEDKETVYVIAGDLWIGTKAFDIQYGDQAPWIQRVAERFHTVIFVAGNHDYWDANVRTYDTVLKEKVNQLGLQNVFVLQNDELVIGSTKFLGTTLWTDCKNGDPMVMHIIQNGMNDYRHTRYAGHSMKASDTVAEYRTAKNWLLERTKRDYPEQKVVVVVHHLPSYQSVPERYRNRNNYDLNFAYFSDFDQYMYDPEFECDLLCHGHAHDCVDYTIDRTRVVCNPRGYGYGQGMNPEFDPIWRIEL